MINLIIILILIFLFIYFLKLFFRGGMCSKNVINGKEIDLKGKLCIVTGANSGF